MQKSSAKRRGHHSKTSSKRKNPKLLKYLILVALFIAVAYLLVHPKHWDGQSKFSIVYPLESGEVQVSVFDPQSSEITSIVVPENLEVEVARGFGVWKLGSVWELGEKEDIDGSLLAETVTSHLKFPVHFWSGTQGQGFAKGKFKQLLPALIGTQTNIPVQDRIRLALFSMSVNNPGRSSLNLERTTYLRESILADDIKGFKVNGKIPQSLASIFTDKSIADRTVRVQINDATKNAGVAENVGELLETIGAKVSSVTNIESIDTKVADCLISSSETKLVDRLALLLGCEVEDNHLSNFDIEISLSKQFGERF